MQKAAEAEIPVALAPDAQGVTTLQELSSLLRELVKFRREDDAILCLLWAAQCWLGQDVLPEKCLVYLIFGGPKSSGKTTATESMAVIVDGQFFAGGTSAAFRDILTKKPRALGIDEVDIRMKAVPELEGVLRVGNRWNAPYVLRPQKESGVHETETQNVGGPKVMNYRFDPEDALSSRSILIELEPNNDVRLIIDNLFGSPRLAAIRDKLEEAVNEASQEWNAERLEAHMKTPEFMERVSRLEGIVPRGTQSGAILLAIADVLGWDAEDAIRGYLSEERDDAFQMEREFVLEIYDERSLESRDGILKLPNAEVHRELNNRLRKQGLRPLGKPLWKRLRRELRIKDHREETGLVLIFDAKTREVIGA